MPKLTILNILLAILLCGEVVHAQSSQINSSLGNGQTRDWQFNYNLGFSQFYGDASNKGFFKKLSGESGFSTGFTARKYVSPTVALGATFYYSQVKSHKEKSAEGNVVDFLLSGNYYDLDVNLYTDLSSLFWGYSNRTFNLYGIIGIGYGGWNTELVDNLSGLVINSGDLVNGENTKKGAAVIPVALGVNYRLGENWGLNFETNLRTVLSDDVDMWADGFNYDQLLYTHIGISYYINKGKGKKPNAAKVRGVRVQDCSKTAQPEVVLDEIPLYDYKKQPVKSANKATVSSRKVVGVDQLVLPKIDIDPGVVFRVQVLAKSQKLPSVAYIKNRFGITADVYENFQAGVYRYSVGTFLNYNDALTYSHVLKGQGVHDAFVVVYKNNKRIKLTDDLKK